LFKNIHKGYEANRWVFSTSYSVKYKIGSNAKILANLTICVYIINHNLIYEIAKKLLIVTSILCSSTSCRTATSLRPRPLTLWAPSSASRRKRQTRDQFYE
jgi:hypothetical protein